MKKEFNPFPLSTYVSKELFCDREKELKTLSSACQNGTNITLISHRRMGKTGLIYRFFDEIESQKKKDIPITLYVDIYATQNLAAFTRQLAEVIFKKLSNKNGLGKRFLKLLKGMHAVFSYNTLTGEPKVSFEYCEPTTFEYSLQTLFHFLESQKTPVIVAIDEFQQVSAYPEKNTEALLRTMIQFMQNVSFIFSGSNRRLMSEIFSSPAHPFFASTQFLFLDPIPAASYRPFIIEKFAEQKRTISTEAVDFILSWTFAHTYYVQAVCNRIFAKNITKIDLAATKQICYELLKTQETMFIQYRNLLTPAQWELLKAIAKEGQVTQPTGGKFTTKYGFTASTVQRTLPILVEKEMLLALPTVTETTYRVYNCFMGHWLAEL
ncbi:MAG: ATP-binding protein [Prevotellaceae bacterium]|jgi:AAA+ ATPase superfamily predicted ATPase|nr:ATP-binding protein [Prevotellaceae bacterium]